MKSKNTLTVTLAQESVELIIDSLETNLTLHEGAFQGGEGMDEYQTEEEGRKIKIMQVLIDTLKNAPKPPYYRQEKEGL